MTKRCKFRYKKYITKDEFNKANEMLLELASKIGKFISYLETQRQKGNFIKKIVNPLTR